jgi:hypothetical protein
VLPPPERLAPSEELDATDTPDDGTLAAEPKTPLLLAVVDAGVVGTVGPETTLSFEAASFGAALVEVVVDICKHTRTTFTTLWLDRPIFICCGGNDGRTKQQWLTRNVPLST